MENREIKFRAWDKINEEMIDFQKEWTVLEQVAGSSPVCPAGNLK